MYNSFSRDSMQNSSGVLLFQPKNQQYMYAQKFHHYFSHKI